MTKLGADTAALERLGRALGDLGGRLDATLVRLTADVAAARWVGADADRFRSEWTRSVRPGVQRAAGSLRAAGAEAIRQAAAQSDASGGHDVALVVAAIGAAAPREVSASRGRPATAPFPERVRLVTLEVGGGEGAVGWFTDRVRIEDLGDGRSRVTSEVGVGAGGGLGSGDRVSASVGDRTVAFGGSVEGALGAGLHVGTAWVVPHDRVDDLLVQIAANHVDTRTSERFRVADHLVPGLGRVAEAVGLGGAWGRLTYAPPPPDRQEVGMSGLGDLDMAADLGGPVSAGALVAAAGTATVAVAHHPSSGATSLTVSGEGAADAVLGDESPARVGSASTTVTFDRRGRPSRVEVERTTRDGDRVTTDRWTRDVDAGADGSAWRTRSASYRVGGRGELDVGLGPASVHAVYEDLRMVRRGGVSRGG